MAWISVALADVVKRSVSWVSQVERGEITVGDVGMLQRLALVLSVPSRELIELVLGEEAGDLERQRPYVEVLRVALAGHPAPLAALGLGPNRMCALISAGWSVRSVTSGSWSTCRRMRNWARCWLRLSRSWR